MGDVLDHTMFTKEYLESTITLIDTFLRENNMTKDEAPSLTPRQKEAYRRPRVKGRFIPKPKVHFVSADEL